MHTAQVRLHAYLECWILGIVRHNEAEVGAVSLEVVVYHLRCQVLGSKPCLEIVALAAVFHNEVKVACVTDAGNGGQNWKKFGGEVAACYRWTQKVVNRHSPTSCRETCSCTMWLKGISSGMTTRPKLRGRTYSVNNIPGFCRCVSFSPKHLAV